MTERFAYFPGCSQHGTAREYEESTRAIAVHLGLLLEDIPEWACCGATPAHAIAPAVSQALGAYNLKQAATCGGAPLMTACASCFSRLRAANAQAGNTQRVLHIAQVLGEPAMRAKLASLVKRPLHGLPVACYYGCLLTRPGGPDAIDDAEDPHLLEELVGLLGAKAVDFPLRLDCCGASLALSKPEVVHRNTGRILAMAHARGAKAVIVACPMCHSNLDFQQVAAVATTRQDFRLPVIYLTQLVGLALGLEDRLLGLQRHFVPVPVAELYAAGV